MSEPDLRPLDVSRLSDCKLIAAANYAFYNRMYDMILGHFDKEVLGRVMAQKKEFIDAMEKILSARSLRSAQTAPDTQKLVLSIPTKTEDEVDPTKAIDLVQAHETRFDEALVVTLEHLEDETTMEVLKHHRDAAYLAMQTIFETT